MTLPSLTATAEAVEVFRTTFSVGNRVELYVGLGSWVIHRPFIEHQLHMRSVAYCDNTGGAEYVAGVLLARAAAAGYT